MTMLRRGHPQGTPASVPGGPPLDVAATVSYLILENGSGAMAPIGTAVKLHATTPLAFDTSTTQGDPLVAAVTMEAIGPGNRGRVAVSGFVRQVRVASGATRGQRLRQSATAGVLEGVDEIESGTFAIQLTDRDAATGIAQAQLLQLGAAPMPGVPVVIAKASDEIVNNSTALQDDDDFFFQVLPNDVWIVKQRLRVTNMATPGLKAAWTLPSGATYRLNSIAHWEGNSPRVQTGTGTVNLIAAGATLYSDIEVESILRIGATGGTAQFQWAQVSGTVIDSTVFKDSTLVAHRAT